MAGTAGHDRARERIERLGTSTLDSGSLRLEMVDELRRAIGFEAFCWPLTDPATAAATTTITEFPDWRDLPRFVSQHHGANDVNRYTVLARSRSHAGSLHAATAGDLARSIHWRSGLQQHGIGDELTASFVDVYGCWGFLELWRERARGPFAPADVALVESVVPVVAAALRRAQVRATPVAPRRLAGAGPAVVVLGDDLQVVSATVGAQVWLRLFAAECVPSGAALPGFVYALAGRLVAVEHRLEPLPAVLRMTAPDGAPVTVRAGRLEPADVLDSGSADGADDWTIGKVAITFEETSVADRLDLLARSVGLSQRETEVLTMAASGLDTRDLAGRLFLSEHTVQEHFKSIFAKVGVNSRRELVSRTIC